jgi:5'-3' exonuclease
MPKPKLLVFDADGLIFQAAWAFKDSLTRLSALAAKERLDNIITNIIKETEAEFYTGFYGENNSQTFRHYFATLRPYKGSRTTEPWQNFFKPILKEHFKNKWNFHGLKSLEADDAVVIAFEQYKEDYDVIISSDDKDNLQIGSYKQFFPRKDKFYLREIEHWEGRKHFYSQLLMGDGVDNINGVTGIGKASKALKHIENLIEPTEERLFNFVVQEYIRVYKDKYLYYLVENYILLNMLRKPCFDYPEKVNIFKVEEKSTKIEDLNSKLLNL